MQKSNFSAAVSRSNIIGAELQNEVAPRILEDEEGIDPNSLAERFIPNRLRGISYDRATKNASIVFWVFKAGPRLNKVAFQKHVGELIFLKKRKPRARCGMILGVGDVRSSGIIEYEKAYRALWDVVYVIEKRGERWSYPPSEIHNVDQTTKDVAKEILRKHVRKRIPLQKYNRFCSLPALTGSSDIAVPAALLKKAHQLGVKNITPQLVYKTFNKLIYQCKNIGLKRNELKTLYRGLTHDLIYKAIVGDFEFLCENYPHYKISPIYQQRDWNAIMQILKIGSGRGPAKYWDYYNPTAFLSETIVKETIRANNIAVEEVVGCPQGYRITSFLSDLGIGVGAAPNEFSEDIGVKLRDGRIVVLQAKSLAGARGGSGPKQSGYEAHRMAGLSLSVMWSYDRHNGEIQEKPIDKVVVLDGYWKGPRRYPQKSLDFINRFAHAKKIFFVDEVKSLSDYLAKLLMT